MEELQDFQYLRNENIERLQEKLEELNNGATSDFEDVQPFHARGMGILPFMRIIPQDQQRLYTDWVRRYYLHWQGERIEERYTS